MGLHLHSLNCSQQVARSSRRTQPLSQANGWSSATARLRHSIGSSIVVGVADIRRQRQPNDNRKDGECPPNMHNSPLRFNCRPWIPCRTCFLLSSWCCQCQACSCRCFVGCTRNILEEGVPSTPQPPQHASQAAGPPHAEACIHLGGPHASGADAGVPAAGCAHSCSFNVP